MIVSVLFIVTLASLVFFIVSLFGVKTPVPFLHFWNVSFGNTYIFTPSVLFQVWFWATKFNII